MPAMGAHTEIELKWALSEAAYAALAERLPRLLGPGRIILQHNRFYDTPERALRQAGMNVRLRREERGQEVRVLLTCKRRLQAVGGGAHHHEEWEEVLPQAQWHASERVLDAAVPLPPHVRAVQGAARLVCLGGFGNRRWEFDHHGELLCLDRTSLPGRVDHELEIETQRPQESAAAWSERLAGWGIPWAVQPVTKFARYLALIDARAAAR